MRTKDPKTTPKNLVSLRLAPTELERLERLMTVWECPRADVFRVLLRTEAAKAGAAGAQLVIDQANAIHP